ncbi:DUF1572 domain-containing protein [Flavobacterium sp. Sd200]|uniref:DinB family protein n=1 Tax=Flavobacterium sp. Sd200 TaxID=2692211 RepID=UPI00136E3EC7|nr:DinB family protein [Flavobacterium sp. Sd200]MXN91318.1 DUF1572 domain-containing protein [Flavobacterium sp. Sd200]
MQSNQFIANRLREVFLDGKWIANTNYKEQLEATGWQQATLKVHGLNTIAALTYHINYYLGGVLRVLNGGALDISDKYSFDVPPIQSETEWHVLVSELLTNAEAFVKVVEQLPPDRLRDVFVDEKYSTYHRNLEGIIEHSYYHLGQIVMLRKITEQL